LIAKHKICHEKGKLIQDSQHRRDRSKGIDEFIKHVSSYFSDQEQANVYLITIRKEKPRYIRDQLQIILRNIKSEDQSFIDQALTECINRGLYSATDFADMIKYLKGLHPSASDEKERSSRKINLLDHHSHFLYETNTQKRDIGEYIAVLEGRQ